MIVLIVILGLIFLAIVVGIGVYNALISRRNQFKNAFAQIDVQLKRRYDLIPNLVETAKGYIAHERETLEAVVRARSVAVDASNRAAAKPGGQAEMRGLAEAETGLAGALGRLFAVAEAYPNLKANETMLALMEELRSTENRIAFSRQAYNDAVMNYNVSRETFPNNVIAGMFNFGPAEQLQSTEKPEERQAPKVQF